MSVFRKGLTDTFIQNLDVVFPRSYLLTISVYMHATNTTFARFWVIHLKSNQLGKPTFLKEKK